MPIGIFFVPYVPVRLSRACCGIFYAVLIGGSDYLCELEKLRSVILLLIADSLFNSLFYGDGRSFALYHGKWYAIDEKDDIRSGIVLTVAVWTLNSSVT